MRATEIMLCYTLNLSKSLIFFCESEAKIKTFHFLL